MYLFFKNKLLENMIAAALKFMNSVQIHESHPEK